MDSPEEEEELKTRRYKYIDAFRPFGLCQGWTSNLKKTQHKTDEGQDRQLTDRARSRAETEAEHEKY